MFGTRRDAASLLLQQQLRGKHRDTAAEREAEAETMNYFPFDGGVFRDWLLMVGQAGRETHDSDLYLCVKVHYEMK